MGGTTSKKGVVVDQKDLHIVNKAPDRTKLIGSQKFLMGLQISSIIAMTVFWLVAIGWGIPMTINVDNTASELNNLEGRFNITDDSKITNECGTIDYIKKEMRVKVPLKMSDGYLSTRHFSHNNVLRLGRLQFGDITTEGEERKTMSIAEDKIEIIQGTTYAPKKISIGFFTEGETSEVQKRCGTTIGPAGARPAPLTYGMYMLLQTRGSERFLFRCYCVHLNERTGSYNQQAGNNDICTDPAADKSTFVNYDRDNFWVERCEAKPFCYNWHQENQDAVAACPTGGPSAPTDPPTDGYYYCSNMP